MAGKKFLNPFAKVIVCCVGAALMAYFLYLDVRAGELYVGAPLLRAGVLVAFLYLLVKSISDLTHRRGEKREN